jgi:hypothetical protein
MTAFEMFSEKLTSVDLILHLESKNQVCVCTFPLPLSVFLCCCFQLWRGFYVSERDQLGIFSSVCERYSCSQHLLYFAYILLSH